MEGALSCAVGQGRRPCPPRVPTLKPRGAQVHAGLIIDGGAFGRLFPLCAHSGMELGDIFALPLKLNLM